MDKKDNCVNKQPELQMLQSSIPNNQNMTHSIPGRNSKKTTVLKRSPNHHSTQSCLFSLESLLGGHQTSFPRFLIRKMQNNDAERI
jgi:hypothetical protein